jgi:hypothetical protein
MSAEKSLNSSLYSRRKEKCPGIIRAITFSGTFSGTLVGARSGAGAGAGVWAGFGTVSGMSIGVEPG